MANAMSNYDGFFDHPANSGRFGLERAAHLELIKHFTQKSLPPEADQNTMYVTYIMCDCCDKAASIARWMITHTLLQWPIRVILEPEEVTK